MDIDKLTIGEARELAAMFSSAKHEKRHPYEIGKPYFIRTVTHHYTGLLVEVFEHELVLEKAAWIADDGKFGEAMETGNYEEIEPYGDSRVVIGRGAILDAHTDDAVKLPREKK